MDALLEQLRADLPPLVSRREAARLGRWAAGTLANKDSAGTGPERVVIGGRSLYPRESFLEWFASQVAPARPVSRKQATEATPPSSTLAAEGAPAKRGRGRPPKSRAEGGAA